jgi:choline dehydrogenase
VDSDSVGRVSLPSADPRVLPEVQQPFSALSDHDVSLLAEGIGLARRLANTRALARFLDDEVRPGSVSDLQSWIRANVEGYRHPVGTCRMGPSQNPLSVVGPTGRVHHVDGLFIADASIFPTTPRANSNLPTLGLAEMVASVLTL